MLQSLDYNSKSEWHFFTLSHGKNPCDGVGVTVKQLIANASLKANHDNCILTPKLLYEWGTKNIKGIFLFYVSTETVRENSLTHNLRNRYSLANITSQYYSNFLF